MFFRFCLLFFINSLLTLISTGQSVYISPEINLRNDFSYYLLDHPNGNVSLIRDKSFRLSFQTLNPEFQWSTEKAIDLNVEKWRLMEVYEKENQIQFFYLSKDEGEYALKYALYDQQANLLKEKNLFLSEGKGISTKGYSMLLSENKVWLYFNFRIEAGEKMVMLYNRQEDSIYYLNNFNSVVEEFPGFQLEGSEISNHGELYLFGKTSESQAKKNKSSYLIFCLTNSGSIKSKQYFESADAHFSAEYIKVDNENDRVAIAGVYSTKPGQDIIGYGLCFVHTNGIIDLPQLTEFDQEMIKKWNGNLKKQSLDPAELKVRDLCFGKNGACLVFFERTKELSRRPYFSTVDPTSQYPSRWHDYYFDDILISSFAADSKFQWTKILHKRQYSQDDEGLFSSFFIFKTNALLRLIFNDAINAEGTVSEYLLKPNGDFIRKSILNTHYKNLNLRFQDALQLSADSFIVPSENGAKLSLVKIVFD